MSSEIKPVLKLLTIEEVSLRLKLSRGAVYQMIARREIPFIKIGRRVRFDDRDLTSWIDQQKIEAINNSNNIKIFQ